MIGILTGKNFFHVRDEDLAINVAYFVLGHYYSCSGNYCRPIGETVRYPKQEVVDWLRQDVVSSGRYSRS